MGRGAAASAGMDRSLQPGGAAQRLEHAGAGRVLCGVVSQKQDTTCPQLSGAVHSLYDATGILLNFIAMAPKLSQVRPAYRYIFPSLLGIRLADRIKEDAYRDMMTKVNEAGNIEFGRIEAMVAGYSDDLKSDFRKVYHRKL